jgi:hypothetical protein
VRGWPLESSFFFFTGKGILKILFLPTTDHSVGVSITGKATERKMRNSNSDRGKRYFYSPLKKAKLSLWATT